MPGEYEEQQGAVSVAGVEQRGRGHGGNVARCKDFVYCPKEMPCLCRILMVGFTRITKPFGSSFLEEFNFLLPLLVRDLETNKSEALSPVSGQ